MSVLTYNGISLPYGDNTLFSQRAIRDDSDTDWHLTQFEIAQQCLISADYLSMLAPDLVGSTSSDLGTAAGVMQVVQQRLLQHRKKLSFMFNGVELIPQPQPGLVGTVDDQNGPKPQSCTFFELTNQLFLLNYHIKAAYWVSPLVSKNASPILTNQTGNPVLYNRWSERVLMNELQMSKRTREGKYIIRSSNVFGAIADDLRRAFAVTGVPQGFLRTEAEYTQSPDGLGIQYRIVDEEQFKMPPPPAFWADGEYTESTTQGGGVRYGTVWVTLRGAKNTDQAILQKTAVQVAWQKLNTIISIPIPGGQITTAIPIKVIMGAAVRVKLYRNEVMVRIDAMLPPKKTRVSQTAFSGVSVNTPGSDGLLYTPPYQDLGTANLLLQAAAYYDPSLRGNSLNRQTDQMFAGAPVGTAGKVKGG